MKRCSLLILLIHVLNVVNSFMNESRLEAEAIVGGNEARIGQFKHMVSLQMDEHHVCGGCIIGNQHVMTAAHCIITEENGFNMESKFTVVAGVVEAMFQTRRVLRLKVIKAYVPRVFTRKNPNPAVKKFREIGDIAVLKLVKGFGVNNRAVSIINLPTEIASFIGRHPIVTGYGVQKVKTVKDPRTKEEVQEVHTDYSLRYSETTVLSNSECSRRQFRVIHPEHLCAQVKQRDTKNPEGICSGDSGGPLVLDNEFVIGIVSYAPSNCYETVTPGVYTRITYFVPFIKSAMKDEASMDIRTHTYY